MAKGQLRGNKEAKKPKKPKIAAPSPAARQPAKKAGLAPPKPRSAPGGRSGARAGGRPAAAGKPSRRSS